MLLIVYFCFLVKRQAFKFLSDYSLTTRNPDFSFFSLIASSIIFKPASKALYLLTFLHSLRIRNLNALAYLGKKYYLCIEMSGKGLISRMSDECLMKGKSGMLYFGEYQAGMRKFTLARKAFSVFSLDFTVPLLLIGYLDRVFKMSVTTLFWMVTQIRGRF